MTRQNILIVAGTVLFAAILFLGRGPSTPTPPTGNLLPPPGGALTLTYTIEGRQVPLVNGKADQEAAPGSASRMVTAALGEPVFGDLDGDSVPDSALMVTQSSGGSGTFFYIVAASGIRTPAGNAILLGDRIAPQNIRVVNRVIEVSYAERAEGEPLTAPPSVGVTKRIRWEGGFLREQ